MTPLSFFSDSWYDPSINRDRATATAVDRFPKQGEGALTCSQTGTTSRFAIRQTSKEERLGTLPWITSASLTS
jgi:hypothetical protein